MASVGPELWKCVCLPSPCSMLYFDGVRVRVSVARDETVEKEKLTS